MFQLYLHTHKALCSCFDRSHNLANARHKSTANKVWSPISLVLYFSFPSTPSLSLLHSLGASSIPSSLHLPFWTRDEAEMEYLKIAQDLDMYGVNYFLIRVSPCWFLLYIVFTSKPIWETHHFHIFSSELEYKNSCVISNNWISSSKNWHTGCSES